MNPNNQNTNISNSNEVRPSIQFSSRNSVNTSDPRIQTTHYSTNQNSSSQGIPQNYQTVTFEQQALNQHKILNGYTDVFDRIPTEERFVIRDDMEECVERLKKFSKNIIFDISHESSKSCKQHACKDHLEEKANLVYKVEDGKTIFIDNFCDICLDDFNHEEKGYKSEHFTSVLRKRREEIAELDQETFQKELHVENIWENLKSLILKNASKAIEYTYQFRENYINNISQTAMTEKMIEDLRVFLSKILNKKKEIDFRGIGERPQLKQQYISLAIFLLTYNKKGLLSLDFYELERCLKQYILEIYNLRQETLNGYTQWLRLSIENYKVLCHAGNLQIDNTFLNSINVDLYSGVRVETRDSGEYMQKYNDLLIKYNTEIKAMDQTIYNLRNSVNSTNIQVQEVMFNFQF